MIPYQKSPRAVSKTAAQGCRLTREPRESSKKEQAKDIAKYFMDVEIGPREPGLYLNFVVALTELYER